MSKCGTDAISAHFQQLAAVQSLQRLHVVALVGVDDARHQEHRRIVRDRRVRQPVLDGGQHLLLHGLNIADGVRVNNYRGGFRCDSVLS